MCGELNYRVEYERQQDYINELQCKCEELNKTLDYYENKIKKLKKKNKKLKKQIEKTKRFYFEILKRLLIKNNVRLRCENGLLSTPILEENKGFFK